MTTLPHRPIQRPATHAEKVLRRDVQACDDPICSCEPEPRWLALRDSAEDSSRPGDWEVLKRSPSEEF